MYIREVNPSLGHMLDADLYAVTGRPASYVHEDYDSLEKRGMRPDIIQMVKWMNEHGYYGDRKADLSKTRQEFPGLKTFEEWLKSTGCTLD